MAVIVQQLAAEMPDRRAIYFWVCDTVCAAMLLGLVLACLWVIFRRSAFPWRTAWRISIVQGVRTRWSWTTATGSRHAQW